MFFWLLLINCSLGFYIPKISFQRVSFLLQLDWWECNNEVKGKAGWLLLCGGLTRSWSPVFKRLCSALGSAPCWWQSSFSLFSSSQRKYLVPGQCCFPCIQYKAFESIVSASYWLTHWGKIQMWSFTKGWDQHLRHSSLFNKYYRTGVKC